MFVCSATVLGTVDYRCATGTRDQKNFTITSIRTYLLERSWYLGGSITKRKIRPQTVCFKRPFEQNVMRHGRSRTLSATLRCVAQSTIFYNTINCHYTGANGTREVPALRPRTKVTSNDLKFPISPLHIIYCYHYDYYYYFRVICNHNSLFIDIPFDLVVRQLSVI